MTDEKLHNPWWNCGVLRSLKGIFCFHIVIPTVRDSYRDSLPFLVSTSHISIGTYIYDFIPTFTYLICGHFKDFFCLNCNILCFWFLYFTQYSKDLYLNFALDLREYIYMHFSTSFSEQPCTSKVLPSF